MTTPDEQAAIVREHQSSVLQAIDALEDEVELWREKAKHYENALIRIATMDYRGACPAHVEIAAQAIRGRGLEL